ncbi:MAG: prephenate dehydrogenase/arogenate dehydrogenase family protein [Betaproteobacteria bacterium]|nr:prephenate dehydrogenase/arogenate dehydrogenase family protein [Betaproteobacteria bacterium]
MPRTGRLAVIGVGLIGGSFALALKRSGVCDEVVGVGRTPDNLRIALERGAIDRIETDAARSVRGAGLVMVATPVAQIAQTFASIAPALEPQALVMDAGSTKQDVVAAARSHLGVRISQFVPAHPIAGAEHSGAAAASADLFDGKRVVLAPLAESAGEFVKRAEEIWSACGARVFRMGAAEHDEVFAAVSHLPHLLAYALVHEVSTRGNAGQLFGYAAGGFRDFTRIASSHPEMWRDICAANRDALLEEIDRYGSKLAELRVLIEQRDLKALERVFDQARAARNRWLAGEYEP